MIPSGGLRADCDTPVCGKQHATGGPWGGKRLRRKSVINKADESSPASHSPLRLPLRAKQNGSLLRKLASKLYAVCGFYSIDVDRAVSARGGRCVEDAPRAPGISQQAGRA